MRRGGRPSGHRRLPAPVHSQDEYPTTALRHAEVLRVEDHRLHHFVVGGIGQLIESIQETLVAWPKEAGHVLYEKEHGAQDPHKLEIAEQKGVAWIADASVVDPMRGEALAWRPAHQNVATRLLEAGGRTHDSGIKLLDIVLIEKSLRSR